MFHNRSCILLPWLAHTPLGSSDSANTFLSVIWNICMRSNILILILIEDSSCCKTFYSFYSNRIRNIMYLYRTEYIQDAINRMSHSHWSLSKWECYFVKWMINTVARCSLCAELQSIHVQVGQEGSIRNLVALDSSENFPSEVRFCFFNAFADFPSDIIDYFAFSAVFLAHFGDNFLNWATTKHEPLVSENIGF